MIIFGTTGTSYKTDLVPILLSQDVVPEIKPLDQRKVLFEQLKGEYEHRDLINEAKSQGISPRTAFRWNEKWQQEGLIIKEKHHYGFA